MLSQTFNITEISTDVKVLGLAKMHMVFENASTLTEEDFDPSIEKVILE
jgi:electron transfer flavoprotein alpha subunit